MKIYVASSWRNTRQPQVVAELRYEGHKVYDFRKPAPGVSGFSWEQISPGWHNWSPEQFRNALDHPLAQKGFSHDIEAMEWADVIVLVMPCGRSAHLEAGWGTGHPDKKVAILLDVEKAEPELMYKQADLIAINFNELLAWLKGLS